MPLVLSSLPALALPCPHLPFLRIAQFFPVPPLPAFLLFSLLTLCPLPPPLLSPVLAVLAVARAAAVRGRVRGWGWRGRRRGGFSAPPPQDGQRRAAIQTVGWPERVHMWRGTSPSWTVRANQGWRIIVQRGVGQVYMILSFPVLLLLAVCGRKSWTSRADSTSFLDLDVIGQLVCKRVVDLLLGFAQVDHLLLPGSEDTNTLHVSHRTPGCFRETPPGVNAVPRVCDVWPHLLRCLFPCMWAWYISTEFSRTPHIWHSRPSAVGIRKLVRGGKGRKRSAEWGLEACWLPQVTLFDMVFHPFQQLLPAQVPLVLTPVVVLQSHVGVVEGGSAQRTVLVWVLQVGLCAGRRRDLWVQQVRAGVPGWLADCVNNW